MAVADLILNQSGQSHLSLLQTLVPGATRVIVTSPFLATDLGRLAAKLDLHTLDQFHLVTVLPGDPIQRAHALRSLCGLFDFRQRLGGPVELRIEHCSRLHGKAYVLFQGSSPLAAVVTSANLTVLGLQQNAEWGLAIRDKAEIVHLLNAIEAEDRSELSEDFVREEFERYAPFLSDHGRPPHGEASESGGPWPDIPDQVWLKPWGVSEDPVIEGQAYDSPEEDLHFSKTKPTGVKVDDWMVLHGVGAKRILGIFKVLGAPREATEAERAMTPWKERWPWYVPGENLSPRFGGQWWLHNLWTTELAAEYLKDNPNGLITSSGRTLGALSWGADKIRLDSGFAGYVIEIVKRIETELANQHRLEEINE